MESHAFAFKRLRWTSTLKTAFGNRIKPEVQPFMPSGSKCKNMIKPRKRKLTAEKAPLQKLATSCSSSPQRREPPVRTNCIIPFLSAGGQDKGSCRALHLQMDLKTSMLLERRIIHLESLQPKPRITVYGGGEHASGDHGGPSTKRCNICGKKGQFWCPKWPHLFDLFMMEKCIARQSYVVPVLQSLSAEDFEFCLAKTDRNRPVLLVKYQICVPGRTDELRTNPIRA